MTQNEINYLNMVAGTLAEMRLNRNLWENESEIIRIIEIIDNEYNSVNEKYKKITGTHIPSLTATKDNTFESIITSTYKLCKKLSAYAKTNYDIQLQSLTDLSATALARGPEATAIKRCQSIIDMAETRLNNLLTFKVTQAEINSLRTLICDFQNQSDSRSVVATDKHNNKDEIGKHISNIKHNIDILDDLIEGLMEDSGFISRYKTSRVIIDHGKGKTSKNMESVSTEA